LLVLAPHDAEAKRDAGRAGMAGGDPEYAARVPRAGAPRRRSPPRSRAALPAGEALYTLDRTEDARREHRIAELEILLGPRDRMETLWLARIHARRNEIAEADRLYEGHVARRGQAR
jgi:hypothetical protein